MIKQKKILLADGDGTSRGLIARTLEMEGMSVTQAGSGAEAWAALLKRPHDLVIADIDLPGMSGLELLRKIKSVGFTTVFVLMGAFRGVDVVVNALRVGVIDFLQKPCGPEEMLSCVRRAADKHSEMIQAENMLDVAMLHRLSEACAHHLPLNDLFQVLLSIVVETMGADVASVVVRDPFGGRIVDYSLKCSLAASSDTCFDGSSLKQGSLNTAQVGRSLSGRQSILIHGDQARQCFNQTPANSRTLSVCAARIVVRSKLVGLITAYSYSKHPFTDSQRKMLCLLATRASLSIDNSTLFGHVETLNTDLVKAENELKENYYATIASLANALEENDRYTHGHSRRVSEYSVLIAKQLSMSGKELEHVRVGGLMHDIGKIGIRSDKLNKPGRLNQEETELLRTHPAKGRYILEPLPFMIPVLPGAFCHHEAWDGGGYPSNLSGLRIPLIGRIVAVADSYDAMTSDRPYRKSVGHDRAIGELKRCVGDQFDERIVAAFLSAIEEAGEGIGPVAVKMQAERGLATQKGCGRPEGRSESLNRSVENAK